MAVSNEEINAWLQANAGASDATIAQAMNQYGVSTAQMAAATGLGQDAVQSRYNAATTPSFVNPLNNLGPINNVALTQGLDLSKPAAPLTVEQLYRDHANRAADQGGLDYWTKQFGDTVDQNEITTFQNAIAAARAAGTEPAALTSAQIANTSGLGAQGIGVNLPGIEVKDDVSSLFKNVFGRDPSPTELQDLRGAYGMSLEPGESEKIVLSKRDANVGYGVPTTQVVTPIFETKTELVDGELVTRNAVVGYRDASGRQVDPSLVQAENAYYGGDSGEYQTIYTTQIKPPGYSESGGVVDKLTRQILDQGTTSQWGGEGYGSAEKSAADMALLLAAAGITDIKDFGMVDKPRDVAVTPIYETKLVGDPSNAEYQQVIVGYTGPDGKPVDPSLVKNEYDYEGGASFVAPIDKTQVYGNKATGQAINAYYDKASGNTWSGTFAGDGSTAYKVSFQPDGTPIFYSQYGGSSNDLAQMLDDPIIGAVVQGVAASFGGPLGTAALNLAMGKDIDDVAKAALTTYVAGELASGVSGSAEVVDVLGKTGANVAGKVVGAAATGQDPVQALVTGGIGAAMPEITSMIPGYADLNLEQKAFVNSAVASTLKDGKLSPSDLVNAAFAAGSAAKRDIATGGITNRVYDDTITQAGADAFIRAKEAGASDDDAMAAADAASGVLINKIPDAESGNAVTTNYTRTPAAESRVQRERLGNEYAASLGKTVDTLSQEEADNFSDKIENAIGTGGYAVLKGASIQDILSGNYAKLPTDEKGFFYDERNIPRAEIVGYNKLDSAGNVINMEPTEAGSKFATNVADAIVSGVGGLEGTTGDIVKQGLSTLLGAVGEQVADLSTSLGNIGLIDRQNAGVTAGKYLEDIGKRLELPETKAAVDTWVKGISDEPTFWGKVSSGVKGVFNNPLVLTEVGKEIIQEALPLGLAAKVVKYAGIGAGVATDTLLNALESAGSTGRQKYDEEIAKGTPPAEAAKIADKSAGYAGFITMATTGIVDSAIAKKYGDAIENYLGRKATTTGKEFGQESVEEGLIALATGDSLPEALTKAAIGGLVGGKTSGTIQTAADVQSDLASSFASQGLKSTDGSFKPDTIVPIDSTADAAPVTTEEVAADASPAVVGEVASEVPVASDVASEAAPSVTGEVTTTEDGGVTTMVDGNTTTVVDANTNTTSQTTVDANTNTQTTVTVDSNTNTNTQTTVNTNTNVTTSTTVDTNNNTTTQTKIDANTKTQTTVLTDTNTNTQTTVNVNTETGEVIDIKETEIPSDWKPPVIQPPDIPVASSVASTAAQAAPSASLSLPASGRRGGAGVLGLPLTIDIDPAMLSSRETQKAIDPLARVKEAQAELERDAMMNQIDPRLLQVMQQRMGAEQQNPQQQFDKDIGAFARMLSGEPETPENEGKYYAYGSEDSIDDILGGRQRSYKEGGYVQPLMAAEGGMALPLLAKSGGALSHYDGRENFKEGKSVSGPGDGQSDDIPAWLADGEYVLDSELVSALGNGSTKAGTALLDEFRKQIRAHKRNAPLDGIPPKSKSPLTYLNMAKKAMKKK